MAAMRGWHSGFSSSAAGKDLYAHADKIKAEVARAKPMLELEVPNGVLDVSAGDAVRGTPTAAATTLLRSFFINLAVGALCDFGIEIVH